MICIGNIKVGGSGKTPFVEWLYHDLKMNGSIAIISKGYLGKGVTKKEVITPLDRNGNWVDPFFCGDEPFMLKKKHQDAVVLVCKDRIKAIRQAFSSGCKFALLDDGYQQKKIKKDATILMIDPEKPPCRESYLPAGLLRDSPEELNRADLVCLLYEYNQPVDIARTSSLISIPDSQLIAIRRIPFSIKGEMAMGLKELQSMKVGVFCSIGTPEKFLNTIKDLGAVVVGYQFGLDHVLLNTTQLSSFAKECKELGAVMLLCTEKDAIKIQEKYELPISYLETRATMIYGEKNYKRLKNKLVVLSKKKKSE